MLYLYWSHKQFFEFNAPFNLHNKSYQEGPSKIVLVFSKNSSILIDQMNANWHNVNTMRKECLMILQQSAQ